MGACHASATNEQTQFFKQKNEKNENFHVCCGAALVGGGRT
jgi:hypothetical protein